MTTKLLRNSIFAVLFSFVAGLAGVWLGLKTLHTSNPSPISLHERIHHEFNLDSEQQAALHALEEKYATNQAQYAKALKRASNELAAAIKEHHSLSPDVVRAEKNYLQVLGDFQTQTLQHIFAMRAILSPEQAKVFDDIVLRSLHDIAQ